MSNTDGLRIGIGQMRVIPGRPDLNTTAIESEVAGAIARGLDILVLPELCVPGYLLGDLWEVGDFVDDVLRCNDRIRDLTAGTDLVLIWGSLAVDRSMRNQDGRLRKFNAGFVAQHGRYLTNGAFDVAIKTLLPAYRIFDDPRHSTSPRQLVEETNERQVRSVPPVESIDLASLDNVLYPFTVTVRRGEVTRDVRIGVILCEDMWHDDYPFNPAARLVENGAELLVNLSCSPWTWQKNRKRHQVVRRLLEACHVPFVYVNCVSLQNNGKNLVPFDGASAVYAPDGRTVAEAAPYHVGTLDVELHDDAPACPEHPQNDTAELWAALTFTLREFFDALAPPYRRAVIGVSGGIDSAVMAMLLTHVLGPERVVAVNMPGPYSGQTGQDLACELATNLGVELLVRPISALVAEAAAQVGAEPGSLTYQNIQARMRMEILAGVAQQRGGVFTNNGNKIETAFGYCTMQGDMAGALALLADLVKREVRQVADYGNRVIYGRDVIPRACIDVRPTAELDDGQTIEHGGGDPFHYGTLTARGYHDELVRAFTEFRVGPAWVLEHYARGTLEAELLLVPGTLATIFPTAASFIADLEEKWRLFTSAVRKRVQAPPVAIISKRAFGYDLRESLLSPYLPQRFHAIKAALLARPVVRERVVTYGGSFNPPSHHHRRIAEGLLARFDRLILVPCGPRSDKATVGTVSLAHRRAMVELAFRGLPRTGIDWTDLDTGTYTTTAALQERYASREPNVELWHAVGADLVIGGRSGDAQIQRSWSHGAEIWRDLRYAVVPWPGCGLDPDDLPPHSQLVDIPGLVGRSTLIRERLKAGDDVSALVDPAVAAYIAANNLYR